MADNTEQQGAEITLYWLEKSRAQRLMWLFEELNLKYNIKIYKRTKDGLAAPELKQIHPLGKSPVIGIKAAGAAEPMILAESGTIVEYLTDHFGKWLVPKRYPDGKEGQVGAETEEWKRYRFFMHYAEGSLMAVLVLGLVINNIKTAPVPFFIKPITRAIAGRVESGFILPNYKTHFGFIEEQLATSPGGGDFLCGKELTGADVLMGFPLEAATATAGISKDEYPKTFAWVAKMQAREAYQRAIKRAEAETGEKYQLV